MTKQLVFKLMTLLFGLVMVLFFRTYMGSRTFKESISAMFGLNGPNNSISWCVPQVVDVAWLSADVSERLKQMPLPELRNNFCELVTEPIFNVDLDKVQWSPLAESHGPTGQKSLLQWNRELELFQAGGMPFKSSTFSAELQK